MKKLDNKLFTYSKLENSQTSTLPFFTRPYKDELFSSWLLRCSYLYGLKPHVFAKFIWGNTSIWNRDIDKSIKADDLNKFSTINHTLLHDGYLTTLKSFEGILFAKLKINGQCKLINTTGVYHRIRKYYALMYCPKCLQETKYYRKIWRLSILISCPSCKIYLLDRCYNCNNPVLPFRLNIAEKSYYNDLFINYCWSCKTDLCLGPQIRPTKNIIFFTAQIQRHLNDKNISERSSKEFFKEVSFFTRILTSDRTLINYLSNKGICKIRSNPKPLKNSPLEILPLEERKEIILGLIHLSSNWPKNFNEYIKLHKVKYSDFVSEKSHTHGYPLKIKKCLYKK